MLMGTKLEDPFGDDVSQCSVSHIHADIGIPPFVNSITPLHIPSFVNFVKSG